MVANSASRTRTIEDLLAATEVVVWADGYARTALWLQWSVEGAKLARRSGLDNGLGRVEWIEEKNSYAPILGYLDARPIVVHMCWATVNGHLVCFADPTSQVVDYRMAEQWMREQMPKLPQLPSAHAFIDGDNFWNAIGGDRPNRLRREDYDAYETVTPDTDGDFWRCGNCGLEGIKGDGRNWHGPGSGLCPLVYMQLKDGDPIEVKTFDHGPDGVSVNVRNATLKRVGMVFHECDDEPCEHRIWAATWPIDAPGADGGKGERVWPIGHDWDRVKRRKP